MVTKRGTIAVIPARGGSKRLPRKNVLDFFGKPLIAWTIEAARDSGLFDRIIVSTEDDEIAACARDYGAEVPFLRTEAFDDHSPVSMVTIAVLKQCRQHLNEEYATVVQLMANCPIRGAADIRSAVAAFKERRADFQLSCFPFGWMNPWWALRLNADGTAEKLFPEAIKTRSQDLPKLYCPTGAIWIARPEALIAAGTFYGPDHRFEPISWESAVDIDDAEDLALARAVFMMKQHA